MNPSDNSQRQEHERFDAPTWQLVLEAACQTLVRRPRRLRKVKVWLSGAFARPFVLQSNAGLRSRNEGQLLAEVQAVDETGLNGPCAVWLDSWHTGRPCLAVAVEREVIDVACEMIQSAGLRLGGIEPAWNGILSQRLLDKKAIAPAGLLAIREPDVLTMLAIKDGRVVKAQSMSPLPHRVEAQLQRQAMNWEMPGTMSISAELSGFAWPGKSATSATPRSLRQDGLILFDVNWQETL